MTQTFYASAETSATARDLVVLDNTSIRDREDMDRATLVAHAFACARADDAIFVCVECGSYMHATTDADHSREQQQDVLANHYVIDCCGKENLFAI